MIKNLPRSGSRQGRVPLDDNLPVWFAAIFENAKDTIFAFAYRIYADIWITFVHACYSSMKRKQEFIKE